MFNVGGMELVVIGVVALVVLGPDKLPGALRQLGTFVGELRRISSGFQTDLRSALDEAERDAERERLAGEEAARGSAPATHQEAGTAPDPGAAMVAARAELDAIESARDEIESQRADAAGGPADPSDDTDTDDVPDDDTDTDDEQPA
jgi:sec-independent protein translocase protein TatB